MLLLLLMAKKAGSMLLDELNYKHLSEELSNYAVGCENKNAHDQ